MQANSERGLKSLRSLALSLVLVTAIAVGIMKEPMAGLGLGALALSTFALGLVASFPWACLGIFVIVAPWVLKDYEIELGAGIPNLNFERLGIYGITLIVFYSILTGRRDRLPFTLFDKAFAALIIAMMVSGVTMGHTPPQTVRQVVNENVYPFLVYIGMKHLVTKPSQVRVIAIGLVFASLFLALHAFSDQVLGLNVYDKQSRDSLVFASQRGDLIGMHSLQENRASGPLGNSITLGISLVQGLVLGFLLLLTERTRWLKWLGGAATFFCGVGVLVTYTRSVYVGLLLCVPLLWLWYPRIRKAILGSVASATVGLLLYLPIVLANPENRMLNTGSLWERLGMWISSLYFIKASPVVGHGYGWETYAKLKTESVLPQFDFIPTHYLLANSTPHNEFLRMGVTMGLVGIILYTAFLWTMGRELRQFNAELEARNLTSMRIYVLAAACGMVAFYGQSIFTDMTAMAYADTVVFLFLGAVLGVYDNARRRGRQKAARQPGAISLEAPPSQGK